MFLFDAADEHRNEPPDERNRNDCACAEADKSTDWRLFLDPAVHTLPGDADAHFIAALG